MRKKDKTALEVDVGQSATGNARAGKGKAAFAKVRPQRSKKEAEAKI
jgi:hypothetical protein